MSEAETSEQMSSTAESSDIKIYSRLLSYVVPYWIPFLLSVIGFLIYSVSNVAFVQLISYIVDSLSSGGIAPNENVAEVFGDLFGAPGDLNRTLIPVAIVIIAASRGLGTFVGQYFLQYVATNLVHNLRVELFDRLLTLPSAFYDRHAMGHLVAKVTFHVTQVTGAATDAVRTIIREGFTIMGYLAFLLYLNWRLTFIFFAVAPLIALLVGYAGKRFRRYSERIQHSMGDVTHVASEAVQGYREVRTFGGSDYESERFTKVSHDNRRQTMKMVLTSAISTPTIQLMVATALAGLVWLVLDPALLANMSPGSVVAFITTGGLLAKPIRQLSEVNATIQQGLAAAEDIFELYDEKVEEDTGTVEVARVKGEVEFRHVRFGYSENTPDVLNDISFTVQPGETVALVGRSGSGKSTLVSLIPRFYMPWDGEIRIDDHPVNDFKLDNLRQHIAIVSQQVTLFNDTVARNIAYGSLQGASRDEIKAAAKKAYAWDFIKSLEDGLDTVVGDDGVLLSGGQRQRLAIARAFLKDAPILILDEATSALDTESERYIQAALEAVMRGRTTFIIAHRLSTIENADRIFVIDHGRIVEEGSHQELLARKGFYTQLHARDEFVDGDAKGAEVLQTDNLPVRRYAGSLLDTNRIVDAWYGDVAWIRLFQPLSWLYQRVAGWRRHRLTNDERWKSPVPVVVVGNISVGGTGKSPFVIALVEHLKARGLRPGVVSRGYGGRSESYPVTVTAAVSVSEVGDEPAMIHQRTGVPVVVDPDRVEAARSLLEDHDCDVIVSDDGLQHYALNRDLEIAVIDGERGVGNGLCLPAGPLREPVSRLAETDLIVINGESSSFEPANSVPQIHMKVMPTRLIDMATGVAQELNLLSGKTVHAVAGISNPNRFFASLQQLGSQVIPHQFPDHHVFSEDDLEFGDDLPVVMTEKDAVKFDRAQLASLAHPTWYLEVSAKFDCVIVDTLIDKLHSEPMVLQAEPAE